MSARSHAGPTDAADTNGSGEGRSARAISIVHGDCREVIAAAGPFDMLIADPPYGETCLPWDKPVEGWQDLARSALAPRGSLWVFGSLRYFMANAATFRGAGWQHAQDIVWEKHNGSNFGSDRFRRVHELAAQFYPANRRWRDVYNDV